MPDVCPHCGSRLPLLTDAFCPECRNAIDEPPAAPATPGQQRATRESDTATAFRVLGWLMLAGAGFIAMSQSGLDAALGVTVGLIGGGALLGEAARRSARARRLERGEAT